MNVEKPYTIAYYAENSRTGHVRFGATIAMAYDEFDARGKGIAVVSRNLKEENKNPDKYTFHTIAQEMHPLTIQAVAEYAKDVLQII